MPHGKKEFEILSVTSLENLQFLIPEFYTILSFHFNNMVIIIVFRFLSRGILHSCSLTSFSVVFFDPPLLELFGLGLFFLLRVDVLRNIALEMSGKPPHGGKHTSVTITMMISSENT